MSTQIRHVDAGSPAERAGVRPGEWLLSINGHRIHDVLDYKFYSYDSKLDLVLKEGASAACASKSRRAWTWAWILTPI